MWRFTERFKQLNTRARIVLAAGAALALIAGVGGALLAGNPSLLARLTGRLAGYTYRGCEIKPDTNCAGANLGDADLRAARLMRANLSGANLRFANLDSANLSGANLTNADLRNSNLWETNLTKANLTGADLLNTRIWGLRLCATTWTDGTRLYVDCEGVDLSGEALAALPSSPPPGTPTQAYQVRPTVDEGMCLSGNASGTVSEYTMIWTCSNQASDKNQQWTFVPSGNFYQVKIGTSGYCLDVEDARQREDATVIAHACRTEDNANQLWHLDANSSGRYWLINKNSGLCAAPIGFGTANNTVTVQVLCDGVAQWGLYGQ